jgi:zinc protease
MRLVLAIILVAFVACACCSAAPTRTDIQKRTLENGLRIVVKEEPGSGLVAIAAMVGTGAAQETIQTAGIGNFVSQLLLASTKNSRAEDIANVAEAVGGNVDSQWNLDFATVRAVTTAPMFNKAFSLVSECLTEAQFEDEFVEKVRAGILAGLASTETDIADRSYNQMRSRLYEDNGYKRPTLGFERVIRKATTADLKNFFDSYYVPNNIVISVVGDVTTDQVLQRAKMAFAGIEGRKLPLQRSIPDESLDRDKTFITEGDIRVAYLTLGWLAPGVKAADYPAMLIAANALGGGKGSLMFREIRQQQGIGYELGVMYPKLVNQAHLVAYVLTDPYKLSVPEMSATAVLDKSKTGILALVEQMKSSPLSDTDFLRAKGFTIGAYALSHQHLMDRAYELGWQEASGYGYEKYWTFPDDLDKVTAADVQRVARKYFTDYALVLILPKTGPETGTQGE